MLETGWEVFGLGCAGGAAVEVLRWYRLREDPALPTFARKPFYWLVTGAMVVLGGGLAVLYGPPLSPWLAANVGASAPAMLALLAAQPPPPGKPGDREAARPLTLRELLAFGRRGA